MKQLKVTKRRLLSLAAFLAVLGLALSLFAETAGGVTTVRSDTTAHQATASYKSAGQLSKTIGVDLDIAGFGTAIAAANFTSSPSSETSSGGSTTTNNGSQPSEPHRR